MLIIANDDQPGVIGEVGTILGRHRVNIASFALGRGEAGAVGVVNVDEEASGAEALNAAVDAIRSVPAVREAWIVRLPDKSLSAQPTTTVPGSASVFISPLRAGRPAGRPFPDGQSEPSVHRRGDTGLEHRLQWRRVSPCVSIRRARWRCHP